MPEFVFFTTCLHLANSGQNIGIACLIQKVYKNYKYAKLYRILLKISSNSKKMEYSYFSKDNWFTWFMQQIQVYEASEWNKYMTNEHLPINFF